MRHLAFLFLTILCLATVNAQERTERIVYTTGGFFSGINNYVKAYVFNPNTGETILLDSVLGDFSNAVLIDRQYAYVHYGRANGNPAGNDLVYKYNLLTEERVDSLLNVSGLQSMAIAEDNFAIAKGFGATDDFFQIFDKHDLSEIIYTEEIVNASFNALAGRANQFFTSFSIGTQDVIRSYTLANDQIQLVESLLDSTASGVHEFYIDNATIYALAERYDPVTFALTGAAVSKLDTTLSFVNSIQTNRATTPITVIDDHLIGEFGTDGNALDAVTLAANNYVELPAFTAGVWDRNNEQFYLQQTDYATFGQVATYNLDGIGLDTTSTDISGTAIDILFNNCPQLPVDIYDLIFYGDPFTYELPYQDADGDIISYSFSMEPVYYNSVDLIANVVIAYGGFWWVIDFEIQGTDLFGCTDTIAFVIEQNIIGANNNLVLEEHNLSYPNPVQDELFVDLSSMKSQQVKLSIIDIHGGTHLKQTIRSPQIQYLDVSHLPSGLYLLWLEENDRIRYDRFVKE